MKARFLLLAVAVPLAACTRTVSIPSTATAQASIVHARASATSAQAANADNVAIQRRALTKAERIEAKATVIDKYWSAE